MISKNESLFQTARDDEEFVCKTEDCQQSNSSTFRLAYKDIDFLLRDDLRHVRLQLELLKPDLLLKEHGIRSTVTVFGSARISDPEVAKNNLIEAEIASNSNPDDIELDHNVNVAQRALNNAHYYEEARRLAKIISMIHKEGKENEFVILTGGGPGIMEAANRGANDVDAKSIGLNIVLPREQIPNSYVTPDLCFRFHYFALRKMHFLTRAKALVVFPGGFGTLDEMFEAATLIQTGKIKRIPFLLFGKEYWNRVINFDVMVSEGMITETDEDLFKFVETAEEAWNHIASFWNFPV
ncbi:MAG: LOG family protein [Rhodospirillaceae bacterium]|jgi:uncharacterized protein (TIGR00730 family)|nr:LOG family protein [Rhodospirillaceae bacterium]